VGRPEQQAEGHRILEGRGPALFVKLGGKAAYLNRWAQCVRRLRAPRAKPLGKSPRTSRALADSSPRHVAALVNGRLRRPEGTTGERETRSGSTFGSRLKILEDYPQMQGGGNNPGWGYPGIQGALANLGLHRGPKTPIRRLLSGETEIVCWPAHSDELGGGEGLPQAAHWVQRSPARNHSSRIEGST